MIELLPMAIVVGFIYLVFRSIKGSMDGGGKITGDGKMVCPTCGTRGNPGRHTRGNIYIELALWLCFLIPGLIYSVWRLSTKQEVCPACGSAGMIPVNTPAGQKMTRNE